MNKDYKEEDEGNGFVRPFADEYEDYSGDGIEDKADVESEDEPFEEYDDEDYQGGGIGEEGRIRGGIAEREDQPFKEYDDEEFQGSGVGEGNNMLHGNTLARNENRKRDEKFPENRINKHDAGNGIVFEETHIQEEHQGWRKDNHPSEEAPGHWKSGRAKEEGKGQDPSEEASERGWSREANGEEEDHNTSEEASGRGWSAEIFGGTAILFATLFLLILLFLLCKWR